MSNIYNFYLKEGRDKLGKELGIKNSMMIPKLMKIVINTGMGEALASKPAIENMQNQLASITGQKPVKTNAKKDISSFKLRKGEVIGLKVTLRSHKMYDFLEKFVGIVLPRIRDFRGVPNTGFDGHGNYNLGILEHIVFPEIDYSKIDKVRGLQITFVTNCRNDGDCKKMLEILGVPFEKKK